MKVSLNTVKQFIDFELPPVDELVKRINEQLGGVEEVIDLGARYKDVVIVKVAEADKHPSADRLSVTKIDDGGVVKDVPRDENDLVQVVCGAPNVKAGMLAVWLPPKSTVPASFDDKEPFVLDARELRGVLSQGMLAAADELAIGSDHDGIVEINPDEWKPNDVEIKPGVSFANSYGLDDTIIDIENKMFTHRPDLFGQLGVAREIAGILGQKFTSPSWYLDTPKFESGEGLELEVFNDAGDKVPRIMFASMKNVDIKPSPLWLQTALVAMGSKPINNIVDVTNYVMLLTAQPTHAYDYDKLRGKKIGARMAKKGETIKLLNDKSYELTEDDIVIVDGEGAIGLGGIMGGGDSEVDENTRNIVLEVATFDMYTVRKSSMRHGVFTDALTRFNKGQSPLQNDHIMNLLMMSIKDVSTARQASTVFDEKSSTNGVHESVSVSQIFINDRLGLKLTVDETKTLLENVEINVDGEFVITPPFWRTDIELPEDVVEEVGRLYGYDKLPRVLPTRSAKATPKNTGRELKQTIRESLAKSGANEVLTYSFVHENLMKKAGQNPEYAYRLSNALSPDLQFYRTSLVPSLLSNITPNIRAGYDKFGLFETGKAHVKNDIDDDGLPKEFSRLGLVVSDAKAKAAPYFMVRKYVENLLKEFGITPEFQKIDQQPFEPADQQALAPFEPSRSAFVRIGDDVFGIIGELKQTVTRAFKLPSVTAACEIDLDNLAELVAKHSKTYQPLSKFPSVTQDISLRAPDSVTHAQLHELVSETIRSQTEAGNYDLTLETIGRYQPDENGQVTTTFRLKIASYDETLRDENVTEIMDAVANEAQKIDAVRV